MEELRCRHQDIFGAYQIKVRDDGLVIGVMLKCITRHYLTGTVWAYPGIDPFTSVKVQMKMVQGVLVDITKVNFKLLLVRFQHGVGYLDVLRMVHCRNRNGRFAEKLAVLGRWCGENDAGHKPRRGYFYEKDQKDRSKLPSSPIPDTSADHVLGVHCDHGRHVYFVHDTLLALAATRHNRR